MHSCSTHVKSKGYKLENVINLTTPTNLTEEQLKEWCFRNFTQWYILFVATVPISDIRKVIQIINKKYNYNLYYYKVKSYQGITRRWMIETHIPTSYKNKDIYEFNRNVYLEFKNYFKKSN